MSQSVDPKQATLFLVDGVLRNSSPVVLLGADSPTASSLALRLHDGTVDWDELPKVAGELLSLKTDAVAGLTSEQARSLCREIAATPNWLYIENFDDLLDSPGGRDFTAELTDRIASGELAMAILATRPEHLDRVRSGFLRLAAFATVMERSGPEGTFEASKLTSVVATAQDPGDGGWIVVVRFELAAPITPDGPFDGDPAATGALELVDTFHVIDSADAPPMGALIGFSPDSFTFTQESAAFAAAALAAQRVIGRALQAGEHVTPTRGIYYA